ncbi:MAG: MlaD family protein [Solirubrobacterales bacterium]
MVGAVTTLIVIVAVFLAYNANSGLPFVPVYRVSVEIPNAARLTNNNEVRIGGNRVGVVESIEAIRADDATATAQAGGEPTPPGTGGVLARLDLKLDKAAEPLPQDSIFRVRYRSTFGLKYLEVIRGTGPAAPEGFTFDGTDDGATCEVPVDPQQFTSSLSDEAKNGCFQAQTEFDDIANTFDTKTRTDARTNLLEFGSGFAGRGTSLNDTINSLEPLFRGLKPVTKVLTQGDTRFRRFFPELADAARIVAPVATEQAEFFGFAARAFAAISADPSALQETISESVPTLEAGVELLPRQQPFLREFAVLSRELRPGVAALRSTLPVLNEAVEVGTPVLADSPATNRKLRGALRELNQLVSQPTTKVTLQRLDQTFDAAKPLAKYVVPAQTVCNYWNYYFTFFAEAFSDPDPVGFGYRQVVTGAPLSPEVESNVGGYSGITASGRESALLGGAFKPFELPIANAGPFMPSGQRDADCQLGQRGYPLGAAPLPGQPEDSAANLVSDLPGSRGPTTLFYNDEGERELQDTRNPNRAPESWKQVGR